MLGRQAPHRQRPYCTPKTISWSLIFFLTALCLVEFLALQNKGKQIAQLTTELTAAEKKGLADGRTYKGLEGRLASMREERDTSLAAQKEFADRLAAAEQKSSKDLASKLKAAEEKLAATEKEVKEATVKAGSCQQEFNSLNAEYATIKQGLANLGLKTAEEKKGTGTMNEGALDPRAGMEAALVLKENSQQPWDKGTADSSKSEKVSTDGSKDAAVGGQEQPLLQAKTAVT